MIGRCATKSTPRHILQDPEEREKKGRSRRPAAVGSARNRAAGSFVRSVRSMTMTSGQKDDFCNIVGGAMMPNFDPSKMDPKLLMELSQLVRELPPEKLSTMQSLMHNMMAGFDVTQEMAEFEKTLPPGFREKLMRLMLSQAAAGAAPIEVVSSNPSEGASLGSTDGMDLREARLTILRAVAEGRMQPEEAERLLFAG